MSGAGGWGSIGLSLVLVPVLIAAIDVAAAIRAKHTRPNTVTGVPRDDFAVLVPIYGAVRYLENVDYLARYGNRVVLCTTTGESAEFVAELEAIAARHGFRVFYGDCGTGPGAAAGRRQTGGTTRDRLVRDALATVEAPYTVCIDADTATGRPLQELVGAIADQGHDLVSVPLQPSNTDGWLARVQAHEYRLAMSLRRIVPWLVSGACHAGRTEVLVAVMRRHSLFFQGNDVETGLVAHALGYRVGHIPFPVPTTVPSTPRAWFRQRLAWSGGEFRLFIVNLRLARRHPLMWGYGALVMFGGLALRWYTVLTVPLVLVALAVLYLGLLTYTNWATRDRWLLLLPLYAAVNSLLLVPLALPSYLLMALRSRNAGVILARSRA